MARSVGNSKRSSASAITVSTVGFSAFLMDEVPDFSTRSQRNDAMPLVSAANITSSGVPIIIPNFLPALSAHKPPPAAPVVTLASSTTLAIASVTLQQDKDDIPVLEATKHGGFYSDEDDDEDDDDDGDHVIISGAGDDDSDNDGGDAAGRDTFNEDVPVLQTLEDAQAFERQRSLGSKKFSWRESSRQVTTRKKSRTPSSCVPDAEMLLRMSSRTEFSSYSTSSGSLISRKESLVTVDKHIVRKGWLYKQADILYVPCVLC